MSHQTTAPKIASCLAQGRPALIGYLPTGFPTLEQSVQAAKTMVEAGVDIVELGVPYTDPVMDGPVIQRAAEAALARGFKVSQLLQAVEQVAATGAPVLAMSYFNPILRYGVPQFARDLADAGGAGIITADLIPDEGAQWIAASDEHNLDRVFLVAPSSTTERLDFTAQHARGFIYASSTMGVTGTRAQVGGKAEELVQRTRAVTDKYVCVGLGVSTQEHAAQVGAYADGVIVGTALLQNLMDESLPWNTRLDKLAATAQQLHAGVSQARAGK